MSSHPSLIRVESEADSGSNNEVSISLLAPRERCQILYKMGLTVHHFASRFLELHDLIVESTTDRLQKAQLEARFPILRGHPLEPPISPHSHRDGHYIKLLYDLLIDEQHQRWKERERRELEKAREDELRRNRRSGGGSRKIIFFIP
ncbi:hypothetical protein JB92DRAFT_3099101 [Gautieria morchelliformis]|nr:hypothetical protein JB92DRAFT_3099101 [Gautieria morchelliformis]